MRVTPIEPKYVQEGYLQGCTETIYVDYKEKEAGVSDQETGHTALLGRNAEGLWICLTLDGEPARSKGYKTIRAAIKNAERA